MTTRRQARAPLVRTSGHAQHSDGAARDIARAEADYRRFRQAYLDLARGEHNEVALAMIGADMERANALLQRLSGLQPLPFTHESDRVVRRGARHLAEESA
jgi:hypothetical protein